jgi:predicted DNA-binding transcriptional regulator AlpA
MTGRQSPETVETHERSDHLRLLVLDSAVAGTSDHPPDDVEVESGQEQSQGTVVDEPTAAAVLGIGKSAAYDLIRCGKWPTSVLRLGKHIRVPSAPLLELVKVSR